MNIGKFPTTNFHEQMFSEVKLSQMKHDKNFCDVKLPRITINEENSL